MGDIKMLYANGKVTAEQIMIDVTNQMKEHDVSDLVVAFKTKEGSYRTYLTNTTPAELFFLADILQDRSKEMMEDLSDDETTN